MVSRQYWQSSSPDELLLVRLVLWNLPQSLVIHPVKITFKHCQGESGSPVEHPREGVTARPVHLHRLYGLRGSND